VDGKTVGGAREEDRAAPHLLAACTHPSDRLPAVVLAQGQIPRETCISSTVPPPGSTPAGPATT